MTNEQHIDNLNKLKSFHNGSYGESINAAVNALEHEQALREAFNIAVLYGKEKGMEAIDKALYQMGKDGIKEQEIKALEQEPCDDAISRQAVLDGLASIAKAKAKSDAQKSLIGRVMFFTEHLPPVNPQPKTGHWSRKTKVDAYDIAGVKTWGIKCQCDRCDFTTIVVEDFGYYKYCPNCGAKMIEL